MKIAHIAPPWFTVPPKNYGGTESVVYHLIEEQVAQGHDVTLYASGDAQTSAKLISFIPRSLIDSGVPWQSHLKAYYHLHKAVDSVKKSAFDIVHLHLSSSSDLYLFPLMADLEIPRVMTLHSRFPFDSLPNGWTGDADQLYMEWATSMPMVAISEHARAEVIYQLHFVGVVYHGLPMDQYRPVGKKRRDYFAWLGRCVPEKGAHLAIKAAQDTGVPLVLAGTSGKHEGEDQPPQPCPWLSQSYSMGRALWHGDDRSDGFGLPGHLFCPRCRTGAYCAWEDRLPGTGCR